METLDDDTDDGLLAQLIQAAPAATPAAPAASEPAAPRPRTAPRKKATVATDTPYDRWARLGGLFIALGFIVGLWGVGAHFTLTFLESVGLRIAGARPVAFLIPALITWLEIGLWPARTPNRATQSIWLVILLVDAATTAAGMVQLAGGSLDVLGRTIAGWWLIGPAFFIGLVLALYPERAGRSIVEEIKKNWEGGR